MYTLDIKDKFILENVELLEKVVAARQRKAQGIEDMHDRVYEQMLKRKLLRYTADLHV